jgi:stage III sporulation protein AA
MMTNGRSTVWESRSKRLRSDILPVLPKRLADAINRADPVVLECLEEIRLRADKPLMLQNYKGDLYIGEDGTAAASPGNALIVKQEDIFRTVELMSQNSIYAYQEEIRNGYITIRGGHRAGIAGRAVMEGASVKNIKDISGLNIRLSSQIIGCSSKVMKYLVRGDSEVYNTLVISPPQCGKTTMLRDMARVLSDGIAELDFKGMKVGVVDERSEIAACFRGVAQNDLGSRTDVLDGCPKSLGMAMMIRSMSPRIIITDEIGNEGDREAIMGVLNAGVKIIASAHGYNISELKSRREVLRLIEEKVFERYVVLGCSRGPGTLVEVVDGMTMKSLTEVGPYGV